MLRWISLSFLAACLLAPAANAADVEAPAKTRTSCDSYGRCFDFSGTNDSLASNSGGLWHVDPMALANGTIGDRIVEDLADD